MLVMVVFFIAFRWIHLSTPLIRLFLLVLILLLMPTLNFLPVWFALSLRSEERFSRNAETDLVCRLLLEKKKNCTSMSSSDGDDAPTNPLTTYDFSKCHAESLPYRICE